MTSSEAEVPTGWRTASIAELGKIVTGNTPSTADPANFGGPVPFFTPGDIGAFTILETATRSLSTSGAKKARLLPAGAVLVTCIGDIGRVGLTAVAGCATNQQINAVLPSSEVEPAFLALAMVHRRRDLGAMASKTTVPLVSKSRFATLRIQVPSLAEQRAIAHVLRTVEQAREATEQVIEAAGQLKRSLMRHLFTYGPVSVEESASVAVADFPSGLHPAHWQPATIGDLGEVITGATPKTSNPRLYDGPYPLFRPAEVDGAKWLTEAEKTISAAGLSTVRELPYGAVAVTCIGDIGRVGIVGVDRSATNQQINSVVPHGFGSEFVFYLLSASRPRVEAQARRTTVPIVSKNNFKSIPIALPPTRDQEAIAAVLSAVDVKTDVEEQRRTALDEFFSSLLANLMSGRMRVPEAMWGSAA